MKLLIIGFDGATFNLIRPWAKAGHLPNLAKLMETGVHGDLLSTLPPVTSPAWPTFMTGVNPGKHNVFDFIQPSGANFTLVNATRIKQATIWQRLDKLGYRVGVMNVPVTYPPAKLENGFMISGILSPVNAQISQPADLLKRHQDGLRPYRVAPHIQYKPGNEEAFIADIYDLIKTRGEWAIKLLESEPLDVFMAHFIAMDIMKHALWRFMDHTHPRYEPSPYEHAIRDGYKLVDHYIGELMSRLPADAHTIVMSDHGFGPLHNMVNLNIYFLQTGLMKLKPDIVTQVKAWAFKKGITPSQAYQLLGKMGLQNIVTRVSKNTRNSIVGKFLSFDSVDWDKTIAYSMGHVGQVYINVEDKSPFGKGAVSQADYAAARQKVMDTLMALQDKNGRSLVTNIIPGDEAYHGPYAQKGPDLHVVLDEYNMIACPLFATDGKVISQQIRGDSGCHRSEGIFLAHGPNIKQGEQLPIHNILDLAPTIMHLLGEPVPRIMDGRVLTDIFTATGDITYSDDDSDALTDSHQLSEAEAAEVEARLKGLGYL